MSSGQKPFFNENEVQSCLKRARFNSGKTLEQVAKEIGVGKSACNKWENDGCLPSSDLFDKIVEAYKIENKTEFINLVKKSSEKKSNERKFERSLRFNKKKSKEKAVKEYSLRIDVPPLVFKG